MTARATAAGVLAALGLAAAARAQNWTTQIQFAQTSTGAAIPGNNLLITATGTYTFYVRAGIFNMTGLGAGQANHGLFDWTGSASAAGLQAGETLGVNPADSRIAPFDFGPATTFGGTLASVASITNINCARDVAGGATAPWLWDTTLGAPAPQPAAPVDSLGAPFGDRGNDSYTNVWHFTVTVNSFAIPNITISFTGQAGPVVSWSVLSSQPPVNQATPGVVHFLGLTPDPVLHSYEPVQLRLTRIPSPAGALVLLGLGCVPAVRRRRA